MGKNIDFISAGSGMWSVGVSKFGQPNFSENEPVSDYEVHEPTIDFNLSVVSTSIR